MNKTFIIAEIGINHNGDLDIAKMIDASIDAGADAVKFKRDIDIVYSKEQLNKPVHLEQLKEIKRRV